MDVQWPNHTQMLEVHMSSIQVNYKGIHNSNLRHCKPLVDTTKQQVGRSHMVMFLPPPIHKQSAVM